MILEKVLWNVHHLDIHYPLLAMRAITSKLGQMTGNIYTCFKMSSVLKTLYDNRSGSEIYERLPTDGSLGDDLDDPLSPTFPDDRALSPSDDSDVYSHVDLYAQENGEHLVKPSQIKNRRKLHQGSIPFKRPI
jgi:hypothetical protein